MSLLTLTGEIISVGDLPADEVPDLAGLPHVLLETSDGRKVLLSGLTRDECRACAAAFLSPSRIVVEAA